MSQTVRPVSQKEIARDLGVSQGLVSLVLNGRRRNIRPLTYERIWRYALQVGYRPRGIQLAAAPEGPRSSQIGFILRAPLRLYAPSPCIAHVQHGLHAALQTRGYRSVFLGSEDELRGPKLRHTCHLAGGLHGVVLLGRVEADFHAEVRSLVRRVVAITAKRSGQSHEVISNDASAATQLVQYLRAEGHRRIAWVGGNTGLGHHEVRLSALKSALQEAGLGMEPRYCITLIDGDRADGAEAVHRLWADRGRADYPTALVTYNTSMAIGAVLALQRLGVQVPEEVSVVSAEVSRLNLEGPIRVTGAGTPPEKLGEAAGAMLLDITGTENESPAEKVLEAELVLGNTSGRAVGKPL